MLVEFPAHAQFCTAEKVIGHAGRYRRNNKIAAPRAPAARKKKTALEIRRAAMTPEEMAAADANLAAYEAQAAKELAALEAEADRIRQNSFVKKNKYH